MSTWRSPAPPPTRRIGPAGALLAVLRGAALIVVLVTGLTLLLALRLVERPAFGRARPWTPWITLTVCRIALRLVGLRREQRGSPMRSGGAMVANHASWLDIFVLNAGAPLYFVSKAEVANWPGIGWLARATGTIFITRTARDAARQRALFADRLSAGHMLLFFPEGTSTDGQQVLGFKSTLFSAFFDPALREHARIQPVSVRYLPAPGMDARLYGWWGDMGFGPHLLRVLAHSRGGRVIVTYHDPLGVAAHPDRKTLALAAETATRAGFREDEDV